MNIPAQFKIWKYPLALKAKYWIKKQLHSDTVSLTYWLGYRPFFWETTIKAYNWGDYINETLASIISKKCIIPSFMVPSDSKVAMAGSILPWAMDANTIVWGSGCLDRNDVGWNDVQKPKEIRAVRGPLTREVLLKYGIECPEVYGDPILCFPLYYTPIVNKKGRIGIIPHVSSQKEAELLKRNASVDLLIINPANFQTWHDFIDQVVSCKIVFSSSLHGLIVADAYGVPNCWISFRVGEHPDNYFKFKDYFLSVGKKSLEAPKDISEVDFCDIESYIDSWTAPKIDTDKLLSVCPLL